MEHSEAIRLTKECLLENITDEKTKMEIKHHIAQCDVCKGALGDKIMALVGTSQSLISGELEFLTCEECLGLLPEYSELEKNKAKERSPLVWRHLKVCSSCKEVYHNLHEIVIKEKPEVFGPSPKGPTFAAIHEKKRFEALMSKFGEIIKKSPSHDKEPLRKIKPGLEELFQKAFTYPTPSFTPVFGEHRATVFSPFGKVRYPIVFEWGQVGDADQYSISIEETTWTHITKATMIELGAEELKLNYDEEYMWELKVMKNEEMIDEITGFFSLINQKELKEIEKIEERLRDVEPEEDRHLIFGGMLEEKELIIEAINKYQKSYTLQPSPSIAYRIAYCYDKLELEELRGEWVRKVF